MFKFRIDAAIKLKKVDPLVLVVQALVDEMGLMLEEVLNVIEEFLILATGTPKEPESLLRVSDLKGSSMQVGCSI